MKQTYHIEIQGVVQGVGFRPFIYRLAKELDLKGEVWNSHSGVEILLQANRSQIDIFLAHVKSNPPPLSKIMDIAAGTIETKEDFSDFCIKSSSTKERSNSVIIPPDIGICKECEKELFDPGNRRYLYPFINCVDCGPRYTILNKLPYDRKNSTIQKFNLCKSCEEEYKDPKNRRFHAQTIGCSICGPKISLYDKNSDIAQGQKAIELLSHALGEGKIAAIKGLGGYHLICDATNTKAVESLRKRKNRIAKAFAVMVKDLKDAKALITLTPYEEKVLLSSQKPILIGKKNKISSLSPMVAPNINKLGILLPYTPIQMILLKLFKKPIVVTSANLSGTPISATYDEIQKLHHLWDFCLEHNIEIANKCDDSVLMTAQERSVMIRNARGYTPIYFKLPFMVKKNILCLGANQKDAISICYEDHLIVSPHIGDLESIESLEYFEKTINFFKDIYRFTPDIIVCDKHPGYETTKWAKKQNIQVVQVQHHFAHICSVIFEQNVREEVLGVSFDGTGYGDDGKLWGGEFLHCSKQDYERVGHIKYFKLLGGEMALKEPRRIALSLLFSIYGKEAMHLKNPTIASFDKKELENFYILYKNNLNTPLSSSVGRLFDAVASLAGICQNISYEGESGLQMEAFYNENVTQSYPFYVTDREIEWSVMIEAILKEDDPILIVSKFFNTLVEMIVYFYKIQDLKIVLSGGVFQNQTLVKLIIQKIPDVILGEKIAVNDGSICIGQAAYALNMLK